MTETKKKNEERPYLIIFTPVLLRVLALVTLGMAIALFVAGLLSPQYFEVDIARFILCLAVATTLSIFFFVFYPQSMEFKLPTAVGSSLRVIGPAALWFGVFLFLWQQMPSPPAGRVFKPMKNGRPGGLYYSTDTKLWAPGHEINYRLIKNNDDRGLFGIYIEFERNVRSYKAKLEHPPYEPIDVEFSRTGPEYFEVSAMKIVRRRP